ncbi:NADPH:quinone reductase-like Zn-dependent oxidoreductase [Streptomyces sp. BK022]|uniref:quinone oxidoreductase family protein n=1 Tax=Streptomyces sp. BK022 TaxID=2512123 RepID=UPI0010291726|nr:NADP-dependent oxidoreductase [Streptomyces sp. BK022]RZU28497.1 NADPH:quinone reductase-like Zn-dependent oxidoreductase [Streptomyces sp. BK022]
MRAVQIDRHGGLDVLALREVAAPEPAAGEVLIRTAASSLNPVDWKSRAWQVGPPLPATLGWDISGRVVASNDPVHEVGAQVIAMSAQIATGRGTWAELVALPGHLLAPAPATVPLADAAALPLAGTTALQALRATGLGAGERLLVVGAAGAVGGLVVQLARLTGAQVDALVSRPGHEPAAVEFGAERAWHRPQDLPRGRYTAVLDTAGADVAAALVPGGRFVSIADHPLPDVPGARKSYVQENAADLARLAKLVDTDELRLRIAARFPLDDIRTAHERFEAGGLLGKVLITF